MVRLTIVAFVVIVTLFVALQNRHVYVTLYLLFGESVALPLYQPLLVALAIGGLAAALLLAPPMIKCRLELRRQSRALRNVQADLERQRRIMERQRPIQPICDTESTHDQ